MTLQRIAHARACELIHAIASYAVILGRNRFAGSSTSTPAVLVVVKVSSKPGQTITGLPRLMLKVSLLIHY